MESNLVVHTVKIKIMKKLLVLILFVSSQILAQTYDSVKKVDSLYIQFTSDAFQKKRSVSINTFNQDTIIEYAFIKNEKEFITFRYSKYKDFDAFFEKNETYHEYHDKEYLKKYESRIISQEFLSEVKINSIELLRILQGKKIFIIDNDDTKRNKVLVREVSVDTSHMPTCESPDLIIYEATEAEPFYYKLRNNDKVYTFFKPKSIEQVENLYILFKETSIAEKNSYEYITLNGNERSEPKIEEQFNFKLSMEDATTFFQVTHKREQRTELSKKHDLFTKQHQIITAEKLNTFSKEELQNLFSRVKNIYVVESDETTDFVIPKRVEISTKINDFITGNN